MRLLIQRPYLSVHSNYPGVDTMRAYPLGGSTIAVEIWAADMPEEGIKYMENGMMADLSLDQAEHLRDMLDEAINKAREIKALEAMLEAEE